MKKNALPILLALLCITATLSAQISIKENGSLNRQGKRNGYWTTVDEDKKIIGNGNYTNGIKTGTWQYYLSPAALHNSQPDISGNYENGKREGLWQLNVRLPYFKGYIKGYFNNDKMNGDWEYRTPEGILVAQGRYQDNIRQGNWTFYQGKSVKTSGEYLYGQKNGIWNERYNDPDSTVRVEKELSYYAGNVSGLVKQFHIYKPKGFKQQEDLVGYGSYNYGVKTGRWIEYHKYLLGNSTERGDYIAGKRHGLWLTDLNGKKQEEINYHFGELEGLCKTYYSNGNLKSENNYTEGKLYGAFKEYYENGKPKEEGTYTFSQTELVPDTFYTKVELPIEFWFELVHNNATDLNPKLIKWIPELDYQISPVEYDNRIKSLHYYSAKPQKNIEQYRRIVRTGTYTSYHDNGSTEWKGQYAPKTIINTEGKPEYARDGVWSYYDHLGNLRKTLEYQGGKLINETTH